MVKLFSGIMLLITVFCLSGYSKECNCKTEFYERLSSSSTLAGYFICVPVIDSGIDKVLVVNYGSLETYYSNNHFSIQKFQKYILDKIKHNDTILLNEEGANLFRRNMLAKELFVSEGRDPKTILERCFQEGDVLTNYNCLGRNEGRLTIYSLFNACILVYQDDETGVLRIDRTYINF